MPVSMNCFSLVLSIFRNHVLQPLLLVQKVLQGLFSTSSGVQTPMGPLTSVGHSISKGYTTLTGSGDQPTSSLDFWGLPRLFWCIFMHSSLCAQRMDFLNFTLKHRVALEGGAHGTSGVPIAFSFFIRCSSHKGASVCGNSLYASGFYSLMCDTSIANSLPPLKTHTATLKTI